MFFLPFTVLMKLKLDTHITYFGFNLNDVVIQLMLKPQILQSFNSFFQLVELVVYSFPQIYVYYQLFFSMRITPITKDATDFTNLILNSLHILGKRNHTKCKFLKQQLTQITRTIGICLSSDSYQKICVNFKSLCFYIIIKCRSYLKSSCLLYR